MSSEAQGPSDVPEIYANLSQVGATPSDITITLGLFGTAPLGLDQNAPGKAVAVIRLAPPAAKMLALNLKQILDAYEAKFSKIWIPTEFEEYIRSVDPVKSQLVPPSFK